MRIFILLALAFFLPGNSVAQILPIDFESSVHNFSAFAGAQFTMVKDPLRINNNVGRITNNGGDIFEGVFIDLKNGIQLDSVSLNSSFFKLENNMALKLKLQDAKGRIMIKEKSIFARIHRVASPHNNHTTRPMQ